MQEYIHRRLKRRFIVRQLLLGAGAIIVITGVLYLSEYLMGDYIQSIKDYLDQNKEMIYLSFLLSELLGSLLPPEVFMFFISKHSLWHYIQGIALLSLISYCAGIFGYCVGYATQSILSHSARLSHFFRKEIRLLKRLGGAIIVLGALTPFSFTVICMVVGASKFSFRRFLYFSATRYLRFIIYAYILYKQ